MSKPYEKYKDKIMKHCMFGLISAILSLVGVFVIFFVPFLTTDIFFGIPVNISFFDISKGDGLNTFQFVPVLFFVGALVMSIVDIIRNAIHLAKLDEYTLSVYDVLKSRSYRYANQRFAQFAFVFLIMASLIQATLIVVSSIIVSHKTDGTGQISWLECVSGVNVMIILPIIFVIGLLVLEIFRGVSDSKVRSEIVKEKYDLQDNLLQ